MPDHQGFKALTQIDQRLHHGILHPGSTNVGLVQSGALEDSNVDLTSELVNMITAQRYYQANAQTIKVQDSVMQTLINLR
jgi:flagellar hook protein FlgE